MAKHNGSVKYAVAGMAVALVFSVVVPAMAQFGGGMQRGNTGGGMGGRTGGQGFQMGGSGTARNFEGSGGRGDFGIGGEFGGGMGDRGFEMGRNTGGGFGGGFREGVRGGERGGIEQEIGGFSGVQGGGRFWKKYGNAGRRI